jgi:mannose-1-phosphate guanylyltransferase
MTGDAMPEGAMNCWNVVLAGGVGSRFWPLSTPERPKQLLPLISESPMLQDTLERMRSLAPLSQTLVLTNASLREAVLALAPDLPPENVIAEPRPAGTCAALAWAARVIAQRAGGDAVMICVHADWAIGDVEAYRATLAEAARIALEERALVTVGIVPSRPDPGFGYIQPGAAVREGVQRVARFVEKPDPARAAQMVSDGFLWNSGIFAWCVGDLLDEIRAHTPEVQPALTAAGDDQQLARQLAEDPRLAGSSPSRAGSRGDPDHPGPSRLSPQPGEPAAASAFVDALLSDPRSAPLHGEPSL